MCNFAAVRNWLIAMTFLIGAAVSSAFFAWGWVYSKTPWGEIIATVSFAAAASWCVGALTALFILDGAVMTFCACASANPACAAVCSRIRRELFALAFALMALIVACLVMAKPPVGPVLLAAALAAVIAASVVVGISMLNLATCQSTAAPTPTPPMGGSGIVPVGPAPVGTGPAPTPGG